MKRSNCQEIRKPPTAEALEEAEDTIRQLTKALARANAELANRPKRSKSPDPVVKPQCAYCESKPKWVFSRIVDYGELYERHSCDEHLKAVKALVACAFLGRLAKVEFEAIDSRNPKETLDD